MSKSHCSNDGLSWRSSCLWILSILSCLTYIFLTHSSTILCLFSLCGQIPLAPSYLLSGHGTMMTTMIFFHKKKSFYCLPWRWHSHTYCCTTDRLWQQCCPSSKQWLCQNPQFLYVKNNMWVQHFTKASEWLISQLLPWLKVRVLVCKTTSPYLKMQVKGSFNYFFIYIESPLLKFFSGFQPDFA